MLPVTQLVSREGVGEVLRALAVSSTTAIPRPVLEDLVAAHVTDDPVLVVDSLLEQNLIESYGARLGLSRYGERVTLLLEALEGGDIHDVFRRLRRLDGVVETYTLVREEMTRQFFESLLEQPGFGRLYVCSPWVNPTERESAILRYTVLKAQEHASDLEILVITRPPDETRIGDAEGLRPFVDLGASIYLQPRLHSKLYIREPGPSGGVPLAVVGSQNLTRSSHLELGIRISGDSLLVDQLIQYFLNLMSYSQEWIGDKS